MDFSSGFIPCKESPTTSTEMPAPRCARVYVCTCRRVCACQCQMCACQRCMSYIYIYRESARGHLRVIK